ncbi:MAG: hypothetical protein HDT18_04035 [Oscillibacter sp.]|nr:hypothetical protein [Oscillibacter sp.]
MTDTPTLLEKTSLKVLGQFLLSTEFTCDCTSESSLTEEGQLAKLKDDLEITLRHGDDALRREARAVVEEAWERGEMAGFLSGMRAGARLILSLTGEGEILI